MMAEAVVDELQAVEREEKDSAPLRPVPRLL